MSQLHRHPTLSVVRLWRSGSHAPSQNVLFEIFGKTDINPIWAVDMGERLASNSQLDVISAAVKSLNPRDEKHLASDDIQQTH